VSNANTESPRIFVGQDMSPTPSQARILSFWWAKSSAQDQLFKCT